MEINRCLPKQAWGQGSSLVAVLSFAYKKCRSARIRRGLESTNRWIVLRKRLIPAMGRYRSFLGQTD